jgi:16S rRNA (cytosine1402-N4)-methyltransferase
VAAATEALRPFADRATVVHERFDRVGAHIGDRAIVGVLFDLGVSSHQFDEGQRGFSYRTDAPLDMRMDPSDDLTAAAVVNGYDENQLARLFAEHGETRFARRIARGVVRARPIETTVQLAEVVRDAIPAATRRHGGHPARRVFQALRVEVNGELRILPGALDAALAMLEVGGRCAVLSYHSGEDRIVKERFVDAVTGGCVCPPGLPCVCGAEPEFRLVRRGSRKPSADEVAANRRAESARLRCVERIAVAQPENDRPGDQR